MSKIETQRNIVSTLVAAKAKITDPANWTKGNFASDAKGDSVRYDAESAVCFCSVGALLATPYTTSLPAQPQPIVPSDGGRVRYYTPFYGAQFYVTREMARAQALVQGKKAYDAGPSYASGSRFYVA